MEPCGQRAECWRSKPWTNEADISDKDARRAGYSSQATLFAQLQPRRDTRLYRVKLRFAGADPRIELRQKSALTEKELAEINRRLECFDSASRHGPWTSTFLKLIAERPGVRAAELADAVGRDTPSFKTDVRKLKELGLTESLSPGYRLSPRGEALLSRRGAS